MRRDLAVRVSVLLITAAPFVPAARGESWPPIAPEDLKETVPRVDPNADAEALSWDVYVEDSFDGSHLTTTLHHQLRIKVFTTHGKDLVSRVDLPYPKDHRIEDIAARTVLTDGREIRLRSQDVFERVMARLGKQQVMEKSFVFPGVEVGAILDVRWTERRLEEQGMTDAFQFQRDIPVRQVTYTFKPLLLPEGPAIRFSTFNAAIPPPRQEGQLFVTTLRNVPAFREEPFMPPEPEVRPWILLYYTESTDQDPDHYWREVGKARYHLTRDEFPNGGDIRDAAVRIVGDATGDDQRLLRLYEFCRRDIRHLDEDPSSTPGGQAPRTAREVLEERRGSGELIDVLFGSLAASLGYPVRVAWMADRDRGTFSPTSVNPFMLSTYDIAVRVGEQWRFYDPANSSLPAGTLRWQEEGQQALVTDPREPVWVTTPATDPARSLIRRTGAFMLDSSGTLGGLARSEYGGQAGLHQKEIFGPLSAEERDKLLRSRIRDRLPGAEVANIRFENIEGPDLPFILRYSLSVPSYAQATGKRLFFQPAIFECGLHATFDSPTRRYPVDFRYGWSEQDSLVIQLPDGYQLDNPDAPPNDAPGTPGAYQVRLGVANQGTILVYRRGFSLARVHYPREEYPALKEYFDTIHDRDSHALAIRKIAP